MLALCGALCYAELAFAYPAEGDDYVYLSRAYGGLVGYLFGWSQLGIVRPGDIALMAFVFGRYLEVLYAPFAGGRVAYAALAVLTLTGVNILGVRQGKWTQNLLTAAKVLGVGLIVLAGFLGDAPPASAHTGSLSTSGLRLALILVFFTYGGWNEMAYAAGEVKLPERNTVRALSLGALIVMLLYLSVNVAFFRALGFARVSRSEAVAVDTVARLLPDSASRLVAVLICISALGAANRLTFTGPRISYALGMEHPVFAPLGRWSARLGTPARALAIQGFLSLLIIVLAGNFISAILYSAPVVWGFFLATATSVFVLRRKDRGLPRPYRIYGYPVVPGIFVAFCGFMLYASLTYALHQRVYALSVMLAVLLVGLLLYRVWGRDRTGWRGRFQIA